MNGPPPTFLLPLLFLVDMLAWSVALANADDAHFFETKIRPLLVERCYPCHSQSKKQEGGLLLDSRDGWKLGGDSGPAIHPGDPLTSLLMERIQSDSPQTRMPPSNSGPALTAQQVADLTEWIRRGAYDPRMPSSATSPNVPWDITFQERMKWWSLQPIREPTPPEVSDGEWNHSLVDRFLRKAMDDQSVQPAVRADPSTLLRRVYLVLTGLPPTEATTQAFVEAASIDFSKAYQNVVDHLLKSPQFGERFARHWLDVVRYSETHGNEWNYDVPYAWRYRDYVIRAFHHDVPYDRFLREHLAGDLLTTARHSPEVPFDESPLGTAFFRFGEVNHDSCTQFPVIGYDILDNQLDTLTKAFQATTAACARCHDHKLDAISQRDYYALLAILRSSRPVLRTLTDQASLQATKNQLKDLQRSIREELIAQWRSDASSIQASQLHTLADAQSKTTPPLEDPIAVWFHLRQLDSQDLSVHWAEFCSQIQREKESREQFNRESFTLIADFRREIPEGWHTDGYGLREGPNPAGHLILADEGDRAIRSILPSALTTFSYSSRMNGALRSPTLQRTRGKISFEVIGNRFSLARLVFNNCQLNYDRQHSIHHDAWTWITIDWPDQTDLLKPYVELLTFWDNPKFPDPLGTLGKDIENQREPFEVHARDPRSWWGLRKIVVHDSKETPRPTLDHLTRYLAYPSPKSFDELASIYRSIATESLARWSEKEASDEDVLWLDWLIQHRLLSNSIDANPKLAALLKRYREIESKLPSPTTFPTLAEEGSPVTQPLFVRGDLSKPRDDISRGLLQMLSPLNVSIDPSSSGRLELADAIASPRNPLTARVMVNRVWQWIFGRGLVGTPDDFGHLGERPSHPELLDALAARFIEEGWSIQRLVRELVLSRAFQSDHKPSQSATLHDPQNRLLSYFAARRAEAEVIRDSLLSVSGRLDLRMYGPSVLPYRVAADTEKRLYVGPLDGDGRRSIYVKFQLMEQPAFLRAFNLPGGKLVEGKRGTSHTPEQSLAMLNDPLVLYLSEQWAKRLVEQHDASINDRLSSMFRTAFTRNPSESELDRFHHLVRSHSKQETTETEILKSLDAWREVAHTVFNLKEFIFIP